MPELPDVEIERRYLEATSLHRPIARVRVFDDQVLDSDTPAMLGRRLHARRFESADRHGKWLVAALDEGGAVVFHFGMTGRLKGHRAPSAPPEHAQVRFRFRDGGALDYIAPRKLGIVRTADSLGEVITQESLGPDARGVSFEEFRERMGSKRGTIKGALTDQTAIAGLGNVYADEILFQSRIHPRTSASRLSSEQLRRLFGALHEVLDTAIGVRANPDAMPDAYLLPRRAPGEACPRCAGAVVPFKLGGRRGYYCPRCQRR